MDPSDLVIRPNNSFSGSNHKSFKGSSYKYNGKIFMKYEVLIDLVGLKKKIVS